MGGGSPRSISLISGAFSGACSVFLNLMDSIFEARLSRLLTEQQLDTMKEHMNDQNTAFQNIKIPELFDS